MYNRCTIQCHAMNTYAEPMENCLYVVLFYLFRCGRVGLDVGDSRKIISADLMGQTVLSI